MTLSLVKTSGERVGDAEVFHAGTPPALLLPPASGSRDTGLRAGGLRPDAATTSLVGWGGRGAATAAAAATGAAAAARGAAAAATGAAAATTGAGGGGASPGI